MASDYRKSKTRIELTPGESVRIARKMLGMSQKDLEKASGVSQAAISAIESNRVALGVDRAKSLARALHLHPAVLLFPAWDVEQESARKRA